jgi:beta-fructofuranosidase
LSLSKDGQLQQQPAPQLKNLRGEPVKWRNIALNENGKVVDLPPTKTLEISINMELKTAEGVAIKIRGGSNDSSAVEMHFGNSRFRMGSLEAPLSFGKKRHLDLRIFLDRSVLEVFANGTVCATKAIPPLNGKGTLEIRCQGGDAKGKLVEAWPMKSIW